MACTDPDVLALVARDGHTRWLELLDPEHPDYDPRHLPMVRRLLSLPPCDSRALRRSAKPHGSLAETIARKEHR